MKASIQPVRGLVLDALLIFLLAAALIWSVQPDQLMPLQMSYDPACHAYSSDRALTIRKDILNQILLEAPPGANYVRMVFERPFENLAGRVNGGLSALIVVALVAKPVREEARV